MKLKIPALKHQAEFCQSEAKFPLLVGGYGSGKTQAFIMRGVDQHIKNKGFVGVMAEPTYPMVRDSLQPDLLEYLDKCKIDYTFAKTDMSITSRYGKILLRSAENWRRWASLNLGWGGLDEIALLPDQGAWNMLLSRIRRGVTLNAFASTTPEGFNFVYDLWEDAPKKGYTLIRADTRDNIYLPAEYIESLMELYDEKLVIQYISGHFVNLSQGTIYYNYDPKESGTDATINPDKLIEVGMDFNVDPMSAILMQDHMDVRGYTVTHACEEVILSNSHTEACCDYIKSLYPDSHFRFYPDSTGHSRSTKGRSDFAIIEETMGEQLESIVYPRKNPYLKDRFNAMNGAFKNAKGQKRLLINRAGCPELVKDCIQVAHPYEEYKRKHPKRTHPSDGAGYAISRKYPVEPHYATVVAQ